MKTPLHDIHAELGARTTDFAGWEMPLRYGSAVEEHQAVRTAVGLFDLSHMGEIDVTGPDAAEGLDLSLVSNMTNLEVGQAKYTMLCDEQGFVLDDLIVYRRGDDHFLVVANASNHPVVLTALGQRCAGLDAEVSDRSPSTALVAVQGPEAAGIVSQLAGPEILDLGYYRACEATFSHTAASSHTATPADTAPLSDTAPPADTAPPGDEPMYVARTGYTGEDGFELYVRSEVAPALWAELSALGESKGIRPIGLAARDSLRLEAGMALYGNELDRSTTPFDAGAGRLIAFGGGDFVGKAALQAAADRPSDRLVGLVVTGRRPAREGYPVLDLATSAQVGIVTSGTLSPTLDHPVAMARLHHNTADEGLAVDVRGTITPAEVVPLPFYKRHR